MLRTSLLSLLYANAPQFADAGKLTGVLGTHPVLFVALPTVLRSTLTGLSGLVVVAVLSRAAALKGR
jgi:hypothetical protein